MRTDTIRVIEACGLAAWPARDTERCAGWLLRASGGRSRRTNAAHPERPSGATRTVREAAERFFAARGQRSVFRITPLAPNETDADLAGAGYSRIEPSLVMTCPLDTPLETAADAALANRPAGAWLTGSAAANGLGGPDAAARDAIIARIRAPAAFATAGEGPLGYGFAVAEQGWVGLFAIVTAPAARRRGAGRALVTTLMAWGQRQGATAAYLQVGAANAPARMLYERLGFTEAYAYHYREKR